MNKKEKQIIAEEYVHNQAVQIIIENYISAFGENVVIGMTQIEAEYFRARASSLYNIMARCNQKLAEYLKQYSKDHISETIENIKLYLAQPAQENIIWWGGAHN